MKKYWKFNVPVRRVASGNRGKLRLPIAVAIFSFRNPLFQGLKCGRSMFPANCNNPPLRFRAGRGVITADSSASRL